ncbi:hypothetical protein [Paludibacterium purpuratum]|uniref:hypothetical protein n=1 Tax=Paludibacterium purpuratum TaxID=1144873 RepID=UPI00105F9B3D|nr:hypothetical protein [Paludibacterium purpuratum]
MASLTGCERFIGLFNCIEIEMLVNCTLTTGVGSQVALLWAAAGRFDAILADWPGRSVADWRIFASHQVK